MSVCSAPNPMCRSDDDRIYSASVGSLNIRLLSIALWSIYARLHEICKMLTTLAWRRVFCSLRHILHSVQSYATHYT
jgi:hypothetical protein